MKKNFWIAPLVVLLVAASAYLYTAFFRKTDTVTLEVRPRGAAPKELIIRQPVKGANFWANADTILLHEKGRVTFELSAEDCGLTLIRVPGAVARVITVPGNHTEVAVTDSGFVFGGDDAEGHRFFNSLPRRFILDVENPFAAVTSAAAVSQKVHAQRDAELAQLAALRNAGEISAAFHDLAAEDIRYYHAANLADALCHRYHQTRLARQRKEKDSVLAPDWAGAWERSFHEMPLNAPTAIRTEHFKFYAALYYEWFLGEFRGMRKALQPKFSAEGDQKHPAVYRIIHDHFTGDVAAYLKAQYLYNSARRQGYERSLVDLYEQFNTEYPHHPTLRYIQPDIDAIVAYHRSPENDTLAQTRFHSNYQRVRSLDELLNGLKGTAWYIDIWATWCGPCKEEFRHTAALQRLLNEKGVQPLYLSIDREEADARWKEQLRFYQLPGVHLRATDGLRADLFKRLGTDNALSIPRYLLIGKSGKIAHADAVRPGDTALLRRQLETVAL